MKIDMGRDVWYDTIEKKAYTRDYKTCEKKHIHTFEKRHIYMKRDMETDLWFDTMKKETCTKDFYK